MSHPVIRVQGGGGVVFDLDDFRDVDNPSPAGPVRDEVLREQLAKGEIALVDIEAPAKARAPRPTPPDA